MGPDCRTNDVIYFQSHTCKALLISVTFVHKCFKMWVSEATYIPGMFGAFKNVLKAGSWTHVWHSVHTVLSLLIHILIVGRGLVGNIKAVKIL